MKEHLYFQILTSNPDRAHYIERLLPGRAVRVPTPQVDEDRVKKSRSNEFIPFEQALLNVSAISEYKAIRGYWSNVNSFSFLAQITSDTMRFVFTNGGVIAQNKLTLLELAQLPDMLPGKRSAVVTAITVLMASLTEPAAERLMTALVMTEFTYRDFDRSEFFHFARLRHKKMRSVSGAIPINTFTPNPLIDQDGGFRVSWGMVGNPLQPLDVGPTPDLDQCIHGAFKVVIDELLASPGRPLPRTGTLFERVH